MRHWISLIKGDKQGKPMACSEDKEYTAKNGDDYVLSYCYSID
ncbi:malate synthase domain protein [Vibrio parahaemolyticus EKP-026]|nr:malate synthase domain protein [Vibrio parahaemolyticus EKP-026]